MPTSARFNIAMPSVQVSRRCMLGGRTQLTWVLMPSSVQLALVAAQNCQAQGCKNCPGSGAALSGGKLLF